MDPPTPEQSSTATAELGILQIQLIQAECVLAAKDRELDSLRSQLCSQVSDSHVDGAARSVLSAECWPWLVCVCHTIPRCHPMRWQACEPRTAGCIESLPAETERSPL